MQPLTRQICVILFALLALLAQPTFALAADCTWEGDTSRAWEDASNWANCGGGVPGSSDSATIPGDTPHQPLISSTTTLGGLTLEPDATITVQANPARGSVGLRVPDRFTNMGTIELTNTGAPTLSAGLTAGQGGAGLLHNRGTIRALKGTGGQRSVGGGVGLVNYGTLHIEAGQILDTGAEVLHFYGGNLTGGGTLDLRYQQVGISAGITLSNAEVALILEYTHISGPGTFENATGRTQTTWRTEISTPLDNRGTLVALEGTIIGSSTLPNLGTIRVEADQLKLPHGYLNQGLIELTNIGPYTGSNVSIAMGPSDIGTGTLINRGTLRAAVGTHGGLRYIIGHFTNYGTLEVDAGMRLRFGGYFFDFRGGRVTGGGTLELPQTDITIYANQILGNAEAELKLPGSRVYGSGTLQNVPGGTLTLNNTTITSPFDNQGTSVVLNGNFIRTPGWTNAGTIRLQPTADYGWSSLTVPDGFTNLGTIELTNSRPTAATSTLLVTNNGGGTFTNRGTVRALAGAGGGARTISGGLQNEGVLQGVLTVSRSVTNTGSILPGFSPGILTVKGDYVQGQDGELSVEVNGYEVGSGFDRLNVSGSAALDGTLNIIFESDFAPNTGDTFQVLQHGSRSGTFQTVNSSRSGGSRPVAVEVDYTSTATTVRVTAPTASPPQTDFNGDGEADILWRHASTGQNSIYLMNGKTILSNTAIARLTDLNYKVAGVGDFTGEGKADILWRHHGTGYNVLYTMNGSTIVSSQTINRVSDLNWEIVGFGDFNGDGKADILWRHATTGQNSIYLMNGKTILSNTAITRLTDLNYTVAGIGDFTGDGKADILWRHIGTGYNVLWTMNGTTVTASQTINRVSDLDMKVAGIGDFNSDGNADIFWRHATTGQNSIYLMNGKTILSNTAIAHLSDLNYKVAGVGDFTGEGKADILWRHHGTGDNVLYTMNGSTIVSSQIINRVADLSMKIVGFGVSPDYYDWNDVTESEQAEAVRMAATPGDAESQLVEPESLEGAPYEESDAAMVLEVPADAVAEVPAPGTLPEDSYTEEPFIELEEPLPGEAQEPTSVTLARFAANPQPLSVWLGLGLTLSALAGVIAGCRAYRVR